VSTIKEAKQLLDIINQDQILSHVHIRVLQMPLVFPSFIHQRRLFAQGQVGDIEMVDLLYVTPMPDKFHVFWALSRVVTQIDYFVKNISSVQATAKISQTDDKQFRSNQFNIYTVNFLSNNTIVARVALHGVPYGPHDKL